MAFKKTSLALGGLLLATSAAAIEEIPPLGLGTWLSDRDRVPQAVEFGLKNGYDHIDAAWIYRTVNFSFLSSLCDRKRKTKKLPN